MHEMSLALEICRIAEDQVGHEGLARIREVGIRVGRDSGVEPDALEFCLGAVFAHPPFAGARVALEIDAGQELLVSYLEVEDVRPSH